MTMTPDRQKVDRDEVFLEYTKSICPVCKTVIDAEVNVKDNKVFLRKRCVEHGQFEALLYSDAEMYFDSLRFNKPGTIPLETQTEVKDGCPLDCGLCPEHKQHACLGIIEVNTNCNLDCPICFADSGHQPDGFSLTMDQVEAGLDAFVRSEGEPEVVMFSGGEPTIHPEILGFMKMASEKGVKIVNLNTNGMRLAHDRKFMKDLSELPKRPNIYMQFDGFAERTHTEIRGRDLRNAKQKALDNCAEFGLNVTLVAAVERDLNDHELGDIVRFGIKHPAVRSVAYQPVTHSGRHVEFDPMNRLTNADIVHGLADQCPEWFRESDFFPVPCCFPTCRSITYCLVDGEDVVPIPRLVQIEDYLDYVSNRVMPDMSVRGALGEAVERVGGAGHRDDGRAARVRDVRHRPARGAQEHHRQGVHDRHPGLPGPVHAEREAAHEVLRRGDHARRAPHPVLRVQLGRLSRRGARAAVRRVGADDRAERRRAPARAAHDEVRVEDAWRRRC